MQQYFQFKIPPLTLYYFFFMNTHIFDQLQLIEVTDDESNHIQTYQLFHQNKNLQYHVQDSEQNTHLKVSTSTKPSAQMGCSWSQKSKSSITKHTIPTRKSINIQSGGNQKQQLLDNKQIKKLNDDDKFTCQSCVNEASKTCEICQGKRELTGGDKLIKFFEYVLQFKLGKRQSYRSQEQKITSKRTKPNEYCNIYFSTINPKQSISQEPKPDARFSLCNDNSRLIAMEDEDRAKNSKEIHYNYECDLCQCNPIEGPRYHCNTCGDFDLCETCNQRTNHYHELQKIQFVGNKKVLEKINGLLKGNQCGIRSSIKNVCSIRNTIGNKATKSWIR